MDSKALEFLAKHKVCCLAVLLKDGLPHVATMHYSHKDDPFELYFSTENTSRKCQALIGGGSIGASVVVGFSEEEWITVQMDGIVKIISDAAELTAVQELHYKVHPNAAKFKDDPATVFLKFTPGWWRYTDYKSHPPTIVTSG